MRSSFGTSIRLSDRVFDRSGAPGTCEGYKLRVRARPRGHGVGRSRVPPTAGQPAITAAGQEARA